MAEPRHRFDTARSAEHDKEVVLKRARRRRSIASGLTLAMAIVLATSCLSADGQTAEERLCCAAMDHDCGALALERQCCAGEAMKLSAVTPANATVAPTAPSAVLIAVLDEPAPIARRVTLMAFDRGGIVKPPGDPTYLLNSTFRI